MAEEQTGLGADADVNMAPVEAEDDYVGIEGNGADSPECASTCPQYPTSIDASFRRQRSIELALQTLALRRNKKRYVSVDLMLAYAEAIDDFISGRGEQD